MSHRTELCTYQTSGRTPCTYTDFWYTVVVIGAVSAVGSFIIVFTFTLSAAFLIPGASTLSMARADLSSIVFWTRFTLWAKLIWFWTAKGALFHTEFFTETIINKMNVCTISMFAGNGHKQLVDYKTVQLHRQVF